MIRSESSIRELKVSLNLEVRTLGFIANLQKSSGSTTEMSLQVLPQEASVPLSNTVLATYDIRRAK
jgi:hypothetical protein